MKMGEDTIQGVKDMIEVSRVKPSQAKPSQAKPSQAKEEQLIVI